MSRCRSLSKITELASARAAMAPRVSRSGSPGPVPTKITRPRAGGDVGAPEALVVRGVRAEDVLTDFSRSVGHPRRAGTGWWALELCQYLPSLQRSKQCRIVCRSTSFPPQKCLGGFGRTALGRV